MLESLLKIQKKFAAEGRYAAFRVAQTYALLGRKQDALDYLKTSYGKRELYMVTLPVTTEFAGLRTEPAYENLLAQLGLDVRR